MNCSLTITQEKCNNVTDQPAFVSDSNWSESIITEVCISTVGMITNAIALILHLREKSVSLTRRFFLPNIVFADYGLIVSMGAISIFLSPISSEMLICKLNLCVLYFSLNCLVLIQVIVGFERFIALCFPNRYKVYFKSNFNMGMILVIEMFLSGVVTSILLWNHVQDGGARCTSTSVPATLGLLLEGSFLVLSVAVIIVLYTLTCRALLKILKFARNQPTYEKWNKVIGAAVISTTPLVEPAVSNLTSFIKKKEAVVRPVAVSLQSNAHMLTEKRVVQAMQNPVPIITVVEASQGKSSTSMSLVSDAKVKNSNVISVQPECTFLSSAVSPAMGESTDSIELNQFIKSRFVSKAHQIIHRRKLKRFHHGLASIAMSISFSCMYLSQAVYIFFLSTVQERLNDAERQHKGQVFDYLVLVSAIFNPAAIYLRINYMQSAVKRFRLRVQTMSRAVWRKYFARRQVKIGSLKSAGTRPRDLSVSTCALGTEMKTNVSHTIVSLF